jgi:hypothetical protein
MALRTYRAGSAVEDYCRACKTDRMHTVIAADAAGQPIRPRRTAHRRRRRGRRRGGRGSGPRRRRGH